MLLRLLAVLSLVAQQFVPGDKVDPLRWAPWQINLNAEGMTCAFGSALSTFGVLGKVIV